MKEILIPYPFCYVWLTEGIKERNERKALLEMYVRDYIKANEENLEFIKVKGFSALCKRKGGD